MLHILWLIILIPVLSCLWFLSALWGRIWFGSWLLGLSIASWLVWNFPLDSILMKGASYGIQPWLVICHLDARKITYAVLPCSLVSWIVCFSAMRWPQMHCLPCCWLWLPLGRCCDFRCSVLFGWPLYFQSLASHLKRRQGLHQFFSFLLDLCLEFVVNALDFFLFCRYSVVRRIPLWLWSLVCSWVLSILFLGVLCRHTLCLLWCCLQFYCLRVWIPLLRPISCFLLCICSLWCLCCLAPSVWSLL